MRTTPDKPPAAAILVTLALAAAIVPARRATRVDVVETLRAL